MISTSFLVHQLSSPSEVFPEPDIFLLQFASQILLQRSTPLGEILLPSPLNLPFPMQDIHLDHFLPMKPSNTSLSLLKASRASSKLLGNSSSFKPSPFLLYSVTGSRLVQSLGRLVNSV